MFKTISLAVLSIAAIAMALPIANPAVFGLIVREHIGVGHVYGGHLGYGNHLAYGNHLGYGNHIIIGHAYGHHFLYRGHSCYYILNQFNQYQLYCPGIGIVS